MSNITNIPPYKILGILESVSFPDFAAVGSVVAKVDTGAYSGSLHCSKVLEGKENGRRFIEFAPFDHPETTIRVYKFQVREVRNSNGTQMRYFINTTLNIKGKNYPIRMNLANRSAMKRQMLIGRRFLKKHGFLVDVNKRSA